MTEVINTPKPTMATASTAHNTIKFPSQTISLAIIFSHGGAPISDTEYTNVILDGLNDDYHPFITTVNAREPPLSIPDLKTLLMVEEDLIERLKKPHSTMVQVNVSQTANSTQKNANTENQSSY
ncbi:hypothetical protein PIB30_068852 [Stylosanthes scabra]|uniref:Uncharacterized protein n=1 Tax=Stylosanthes scabra TaxID=79078 RepID=A0ABU6SPX2_9FABA|nr:hypothetical protein [Stylosanthes scabra]